MTTNEQLRLQTGYDYLAASLTSGPDAYQYRALLRVYLDHYDMDTTSDDTTADRIERLSSFLRILAAAAVAEGAAT
ncbi:MULTISPECIES: hypothetical protein [Sphingomonadales]|nr:MULTISPECIES: hypothetical protein [Sphingomonadaceae]MBB4151500.1 hypothetical protein [Sphingobium scionense]